MTPSPHSKQDVSSACNIFGSIENRSFDDSMIDLEELDDSILMSEETSPSVDKQDESDLTQLRNMLPAILEEFKMAGLEKYFEP